MKQQVRSLRQFALVCGYLKTHSLEGIRAGIRKYHDEHQEGPFVGSGDATSYVGYSTTWVNIDAWCRRNGTSLSQVRVELGLGTSFAEHSLAAIQGGIQSYHRKHGKRPSKVSGEAGSYLGYEATWYAVHDWLRLHGHGTLSEFGQRLGLSQCRGCPHNLEAVRSGVRRFYAEHGKLPSLNRDAHPYVGYYAKWRSVRDWLVREGYGEDFGVFLRDVEKRV